MAAGPGAGGGGIKLRTHQLTNKYGLLWPPNFFGRFDDSPRRTPHLPPSRCAHESQCCAESVAVDRHSSHATMLANTARRAGVQVRGHVRCWRFPLPLVRTLLSACWACVRAGGLAGLRALHGAGGLATCCGRVDHCMHARHPLVRVVWVPALLLPRRLQCGDCAGCKLLCSLAPWCVPSRCMCTGRTVCEVPAGTFGCVVARLCRANASLPCGCGRHSGRDGCCWLPTRVADNNCSRCALDAAVQGFFTGVFSDHPGQTPLDQEIAGCVPVPWLSAAGAVCVTPRRVT